jgi:hypothetical protein
MNGWRLGVGVRLAMAALLALSSLGCGSDSNGGVPGAGGERAEAGAASTDDPPDGDGGADSPVTPGDLVCKQDDDCTTREKPVCDQVLGCVACQYDWDCPAGHRCSDNECFEKQTCATSADCTKDALHTVCDAVQQLCVGCREDAECGEGKRCEASECVAFEACTNSRDCVNGKVCNRAVGACVACVVDGDCGAGSACVNSACVPTCASDKDCLGVGMLCNQQVGRCTECLGNQDCPPQYFCAESGRCRLDVCEPGQTRCQTEHQLETCSEVGDTFVASTCGTDTRCAETDDVNASCELLACTPGGSQCSADSGSIEHCSADGLEIEDVEACGAGKTCSNAACVDVVCTPGAYACDGASLKRCNTAGTALATEQSCSYAERCDAQAGACTPRECTPGSWVCKGDVSTVCDGDGTVGGSAGMAGEGSFEDEDCAAVGKVCYGGQCRQKQCANGVSACSGSTLIKCDNNGTHVYDYLECGHPALCDSVAAKCITPTCTPGAFVCDANVAKRCNATGTAYEASVTDCSATNQVCDGGGCLDKVCTPSAAFCQGGSPLKCSTSGATWVPSDTCSTNEYCVEGNSLCQSDKCVAGATVCNGSLVTTCAADGSGPLAGGTDCTATQQVCEAGACKAVVCTPSNQTCQGEAVYTCNGSGTGTYLSTTCSASTFCDASGPTPQCTTDVCTANAIGCNGEVISTCGTNGGSWINPGTDCKASSQVCVLGGTCAPEEVSTQGSTSYSNYGTGYTYLSGFRALATRKLAKLETYGSFSGLQKVTWVVYEKRPTESTYDLVYQKVTAQAKPTLGSIVSPALDFTLVKGKTYAVGVHIAGDSQIAYYYGSSTTYLAKGSFIAAAQPLYVSSYNSTQPATAVNPSYDIYNKYYVRFTTVVAP